MFKENFHNQSVISEKVPDIETIKNSEFESEKILEQAQEAIEAIEDGVNLASDSKTESNGQKKTLLEFLRSGIARKFIQTAAALGLFVGSTKFAEAENNELRLEKDQIERATSINEEIVVNLDNHQETQDTIKNPNPEDYDLSKMMIINYDKIDKQKRAATDTNVAQDFAKEQILNNRIGIINNQIFELRHNIVVAKKNGSSLDSIQVIRDQVQALIDEREHMSKDGLVNYSAEELEAVKNAPDLLRDFQRAQNNLLKIMKDPGYVERLMKEFDCNRETAVRHQQVRVSNVEHAEIEFDFAGDIEKRVSGASGFFMPNTNMICIPIDLMDFGTIEHELAHLATNADIGMSIKAKKILSEDTFAPQNEPGLVNGMTMDEYHKWSTERYVRLIALREDLLLFKIMKPGEQFTEKIYKKMMKMFKENQHIFNRGSRNLIKYTEDHGDPEKGYENFRKMFEDLAVNQKESPTDSTGGTYQHPGWDYSGTDKAA